MVSTYSKLLFSLGRITGIARCFLPEAVIKNINAIISSQCIARAANYLLQQNGAPHAIINYCKKTVPLNEEYTTYLDAVDQLGSYDQLQEKDFEILCGPQPIQDPYFLAGIKGVPSDSKYTTGCVLYVLKNSINAMDALQKSIYLGGDVDSVASITTGILAGLYGLESIPSFMIQQIEGLDYLKSIGNMLEQANWTA